METYRRAESATNFAVNVKSAIIHAERISTLGARSFDCRQMIENNVTKSTCIHSKAATSRLHLSNCCGKKLR